MLFVFTTLLSTKAVHAIFTVDCSILTTSRMDPIVYPNAYPAGHTHTIVGANAFSPSANFDVLRSSDCTTCNVPQDLSNYWVPTMYVKKADSGKFVSLSGEMHASNPLFFFANDLNAYLIIDIL